MITFIVVLVTSPLKFGAVVLASMYLQVEEIVTLFRGGRLGMGFLKIVAYPLDVVGLTCGAIGLVVIDIITALRDSLLIKGWEWALGIAHKVKALWSSFRLPRPKKPEKAEKAEAQASAPEHTPEREEVRVAANEKYGSLPKKTRKTSVRQALDLFDRDPEAARQLVGLV